MIFMMVDSDENNDLNDHLEDLDDLDGKKNNGKSNE